jgi:hypothetical protein
VTESVSRADGREENVTDKGNIVAEGQDKYGSMKFLHSPLKIEGRNEGHWKEIITDVSQRHEICKPRDNPSLHPNRWMDPKHKKIDPDQPWIDIRMEIMDQVAEGLINEDDEKDRRERIDEGTHLSRPFGAGR